MINGYFDSNAFYEALDRIRQERGVSWHRIFHETGLKTARLSVAARHRWKPRADTLAALILWSGLCANDFIKSESEVEA